MPEILLILWLAQAASFQQGAEGACADLASLERVAIHAHKARYAYGERAFRLEMEDIGRLSQDLSPDGIIPLGDHTGFRTHQRSLEAYLSGHRKAVRHYEAGDKAAALQALRASNTRRAWRARRDLNAFWSCHEEVGTTAYQNYRNRPRRADIPVDKQPRIKKPKTSIPSWRITWLKVKAFSGRQKDKLVTSFTQALPEEMQDERIGGIILSSILLFCLTLPFGWKLLRAGDRSNRLPCRIPARLLAQSGNYQVTIIDIGRGGAKIKGGPQLKPKIPMRLIVGGKTFKGHSAWANRQYSGIVFARKLNPSALTELLASDQTVLDAQNSVQHKRPRRQAA